MKSFVSTSFFLLFEQVLRRDNPELKLDRWMAHDVEWVRSRPSFMSRTYGYALEIYVATHIGKDAWALIVAKEQWWAGRHGDVIKGTTMGEAPRRQTRQCLGLVRAAKTSAREAIVDTP